MRIGFLGYGYIAHSVIESLSTMQEGNYDICGVLVKDPAKYSEESQIPLFADINSLIQQQPDVIVECAGQAAVEKFGLNVLNAGISLVVISIGALAKHQLYHSLKEAAVRNNCKITLPAGAIGGIDALGAARLGGLDKVCYRSRKPAAAWVGSKAENMIDLENITSAQTFYRGTAGEAALLFPKNSNVAATIALAGIGFDRTEVELIADPDTPQNTHEILVEGIDGRFEISLQGNPSPTNQKTSMLTAHSVAKTLANLENSIVI